jgi:16S rRNA processing protein RimM
MPSDRILVGQFGAAHGVKGEVRLRSFTGDPTAIAAYGPLSDRQGVRLFQIADLRSVKDDLFVARVKGISTRDAAEALANIELCISRTALPAPEEEDEFYIADLIGLAARDENGEAIGSVVQILNYGAGDMIEIAPQVGAETLLVPFTKEAVPQIDMKGGRITIMLPDEIDADPASLTNDSSEGRSTSS